MASSPPEMPLPRHDMAIRELTRSSDMTRRLRVLLRQMPPDDLRRDPAAVLSSEVLRSLTTALRILDSSAEASLVSPQPPGHCGRRSSKGLTKRESAGESCPDRKDQRSWTELTAAPFLDGHEWRKYGQKRIAGANFTRSYYRCTYSDVDGCKATKQVQQVKGDQNQPHLFRVKYRNEHTCRNRLIEPPIQPCLFQSMGRETLQKQAWVRLGISNPVRCEEEPPLSFSSSCSSHQDEVGAPNSVLPTHCSSWECLASLEKVKQAFVTTGPEEDGGSISNPSSIINPRSVVSGAFEDGLLWDDCSFQLDLDYVLGTS